MRALRARTYWARLIAQAQMIEGADSGAPHQKIFVAPKQNKAAGSFGPSIGAGALRPLAFRAVESSERRVAVVRALCVNGESVKPTRSASVS